MTTILWSIGMKEREESSFKKQKLLRDLSINISMPVFGLGVFLIKKLINIMHGSDPKRVAASIARHEFVQDAALNHGAVAVTSEENDGNDGGKVLKLVIKEKF